MSEIQSRWMQEVFFHNNKNNKHQKVQLRNTILKKKSRRNSQRRNVLPLSFSLFFMHLASMNHLYIQIIQPENCQNQTSHWSRHSSQYSGRQINAGLTVGRAKGPSMFCSIALSLANLWMWKCLPFWLLNTPDLPFSKAFLVVENAWEDSKETGFENVEAKSTVTDGFVVS